MQRTHTLLVVTLKGVLEEEEVISGVAIRHHSRQVISHHTALLGIQVDTLFRHIYCLDRHTISYPRIYNHMYMYTVHVLHCACIIHMCTYMCFFKTQYTMYMYMSLRAHQSNILHLFGLELLESPEGILVYGEGHSMEVRLPRGSANIYVILHTEQR